MYIAKDIEKENEHNCGTRNGVVLVNNAGLQFISPVEDFPVEKWDLVKT
ncbi:MAG: hypothetical protein ACQEXK_09810 [Bacillota bacterium]